MPKIVDKKEIKEIILKAFQRCLTKKPFEKITLRDIAREIGVSHAAILNYYKTKQEIIQAYAEYVADHTFRQGHQWLVVHRAAEFESPVEYIKAFLTSTIKGNEDTRLIFTGSLNIYTSGQTNKELAAFVKEEQNLWNNANIRIICKELNLPDINRLIGNYIFSAVQSVCMITYNDWLDDESFDKLLTFYAETVIEKLHLPG